MFALLLRARKANITYTKMKQESKAKTVGVNDKKIFKIYKKLKPYIFFLTKVYITPEILTHTDQYIWKDTKIWSYNKITKNFTYHWLPNLLLSNLAVFFNLKYSFFTHQVYSNFFFYFGLCNAATAATGYSDSSFFAHLNEVL